METLPEDYSERFQKLFQQHERFILQLCEVLKLDYLEAGEEDILDAIKGLLHLEEFVQCDIYGCHAEAQYEGWYRKLDFAGLPTGLVQNLKVCNEHVSLLIGYKKE